MFSLKKHPIFVFYTVNLGISAYFKTLRIEFSAPLIRRCCPPEQLHQASRAVPLQGSLKNHIDVEIVLFVNNCSLKNLLDSYEKNIKHWSKLNTQLKSMFKVPYFNVWTKLKTQIRSDATKTCSLFQPYSHLPAPTTEHSLTTPSLLPNFDNDATCNYPGPQRLCKSI